MGNILVDSNGNALLSANNALEVTSAIDSNIQAGNIKKDVTILGVTGTYEGNGGGISLTFLDCVEWSTKSDKGESNTKAGDPGAVAFYCYVDYSSISNNEVPIGFIIDLHYIHENYPICTVCKSGSYIDGGFSVSIYGTSTNTRTYFYIYGAPPGYGFPKVVPIFPSMLNLSK